MGGVLDGQRPPGAAQEDATTPPVKRGLFGRRKRRVHKFYKQQCSLLENFENDSKQIDDFKRTRQHLKSTSESAAAVDIMNGNETGLYPVDPTEMADDSPPGSNGQSSLKLDPLTVSFLEKECDAEAGSVSPKQPSEAASRRLALITLGVNVTLTIAKMVASYLSGSLSIISSLVDSLVDITSGLVIWITSRAIKKHDPYLYPVGRRRLEPLALVIVSVIMAVASFQMIVQSGEAIVNSRIDPNIELPTICIMIATVATKAVLYLVCQRFTHDPSVTVLAQDHRNDCLSNTAALVCAYCAQRFWIYLDPIGAILVAVYIAVTWCMTGKEQLVMLSGKSAEPEFINRIIKVCMDHDERIKFIDTVHVYHFGTQFLVEVHIGLDKDMRLEEAHDISEALQVNIESLPEVERAFVHVDYEFEHKPDDEHKPPQ